MKKLLTIIGTAVLVVFMATIFIQHCVRNNTWYTQREVVEYYVEYGDTLCGIADEYKPSWLDYRQYCHEVLELNGMDSSYIYAGQTIKIYVEGGTH